MTAAAIPYAVYRFYDADGALLYVGMSKNPSRRRGGHSNTASWYRDVARQDVEWFPDLVSASIGEQRAIINDSPIHNKMQPPWVHPAAARALGYKEALRRVFEDDLRDHPVTIWLDADELADLRTAAQTRGKPISAYVRELLLNRGE